MEHELINRYIVFVDEMPSGLYATVRMAETVAREIDGKVFEMSCLLNGQTELLPISSWEDCKKLTVW